LNIASEVSKRMSCDLVEVEYEVPEPALILTSDVGGTNHFESNAASALNNCLSIHLNYSRNYTQKSLILCPVGTGQTRRAFIRCHSTSVEMVQADAGKSDTVPAAFANAHTVFIVTFSCYKTDGKEVEINQGKAIISASISSEAKYLIFSTRRAAQRLYDRQVDIFDSKAEIEQLIRVAPVRSPYFAPEVPM
ncbi:hypothetical protein KEM54_006911, partial [Ascosphaera aggregata]